MIKTDQILNSPAGLVNAVLVFFAYLIVALPAFGQTQTDTLKQKVRQVDATLSEINKLGYNSIEAEDFNRGLILNPLDLITGRVPGLGLYKDGNNPNGSYTYRMRGVSSLEQIKPLIVVDGMIVTDPGTIEPYDIQSIKVGKGLAATSKYGFRASLGVIEITTNSGGFGAAEGNSDGFRVQYNGYVALSTKSNTVPIMNRQEYLEAGGTDLGGDTNWQDLVSRKAVSQINHLSVSGGNNSTRYSISGSARKVEGVLQESGFDQFNARGSIRHRALNERLMLSMNLASSKRTADYSFKEAFRYSNVFNPTSPVRFDNGNYFQPILFDNFNPLAIVKMNTNEGQNKNLSYNVQADYDITDQLRVRANFGQQFHRQSTGEFYPSTSFFRGLPRDGLARRSFENDEFTYFDTQGIFAYPIGENISVGTIAGYSFQEYFRESLILELGNLPTNELGYYGIDLSGDRVLGDPSNVFLDSNATPRERIIAYYGRIHLNYEDRILLQTSLRREGSSKLAENNRWAFFPAVSLSLDVNSFWDTGFFDQLTARIGIGKTGRLPNRSGLSRSLYEYNFFNGGTVNQVHEANPKLKWEDRQELNIGLDYGLLNNRLSGSIEFYKIRLSDLIQAVRVPDLSNIQYQNVGGIETTGLEFLIRYDIIKNRGAEWKTGLNLSTYKSIMDDYPVAETLAGFPGAPGQGSAQMVRLAEGEELGQIWGPVFSGEVDEDGFPIFEDINEDGILITNFGSSLDDAADFTQLGNAIPDLEFGWSHTFAYKNWGLQAFFRGALGHSKINLNRMFYEPRDPGSIGVYNRVNTDKAIEELEVSYFSSLYVEKADYITLDHITASYRLPVSGSQAINSITAYLTVENAFTITKYTGLNPEPVLEDVGPVDSGARIRTEADPLVMGIDRRLSYLPARTFIFGLKFIF